MSSAQVDVVRVFRALGDPTRLAIFEAVREATAACDECGESDIENGITQIAARFDLALSTVSHHIRELRLAGLLRCERRGQAIRCSVDATVLEAVARYLAGGSPGADAPAASGEPIHAGSER
jgi:DNA-binding transcriptional ArsR family regulator